MANRAFSPSSRVASQLFHTGEGEIEANFTLVLGYGRDHEGMVEELQEW